MRNLTGYTLFMAFSLFGLISLHAEMKNKENGRVGGKCAYESYKGTAKIISIVLRKGPSSSPDEFEIKFQFFPGQEIKESWVQVEGQEFLLLMNNGTFPNKVFIEKHDMFVGKKVECILQVIVKGTCTPITFEFPFFKD